MRQFRSVLCAVAWSIARLPAQALDALPTLRTDAFAACTSADPAGSNEDWGHYAATVPDGRRVLAAFTGPGRLVRLWSADPQGAIELEIDGAVRHRGAFRSLFDGSTPPFLPPLAGSYAGGSVSRVEVPFARSCRLLSPPGPPTFHHVEALLGTPPTAPALPPPSAAVPPHAVPLGAADRELLALDGPCELVELRVRCRGDARAVWLTVTADGASVPTLAAPLDLLLPPDLPTAAVADAGDGFRALRLPMPCRQRLVVRARTGAGPTALDVGWTARPLPPDHARGFLHARWHRQRNRWGEPFPVLALAGRRGHFVGVTAELAAAPGQGLSFLEGDETLRADDQVVLRGTGTEDFFDGAWYFRQNPAASACAAVAAIDPRLCRVRAARFFLTDPVPFRRAFVCTLEHGGGNDAAGSDYALLAFWYDDAADGVPAAPDALAPELPLPEPQWQDVAAATAFPAARAEKDGTVVLAPGRHELPPRATPTCYTALRAGRPVLPTVLAEAGAAAVFAVAAATAVDTVRIEPALPAIRQWRVLGPFAGGDRHGLDRGHAPERERGEDRTFDVLGDGPRGWQAANATAATGVLDLAPLCGHRDDVVMFAATWLAVPRDQQVVLWLGSDDAVRVSVDGRAVHEHRGVRGAARDQDRVVLPLTAGEHELLLEVENYQGGFGCFLRVDGDGLTNRPFRTR